MHIRCRSQVWLLQNESATKALLCDLNSRGWTVVDLAELALESNAVEVVEILSDYCRGENCWLLRV